MYLHELTKVFKPTKSRIDIKEPENLMRGNGWTSNGYWAIKTEFEPKLLSDLRTGKELPKDGARTLNNGTFLTHSSKPEHYKKAELVNLFRVYKETPTTHLKGGDKLETCVNAYYLALFERLTFGVDFWVGGNLEPIAVTPEAYNDAELKVENIIGYIMPIREQGE